METYTDNEEDIWRRKGDGIDYRGYDVDSWIEVRKGVPGRVDDGECWCPFKPTDPAIPQALAAWAALMGTPKEELEAVRPKTWTDPDVRTWTRLDADTIALETLERQARRSTMAWSWNRGESWEPLVGMRKRATEAFEALLDPVEPAKEERPETYTDVDGDVWRRVGDGVDFAPHLHPKLVRADGRWRDSDACTWSSMLYPELFAAWSVLIGDPLPAPSLHEVVEHVAQTGGTFTVTSQRNGSVVFSPCAAVRLEPAHHWSFRCTPERIDVNRIYREMAALGVAHDDVRISFRSCGTLIRVSVRSS